MKGIYIMAVEETVGKVDDLGGDGNVLTIRASGERVVAKWGDAIFIGDSLVASPTSNVVVLMNDKAPEATVIESSEFSRFDNALLDQSANLISLSSIDNPVNIGVKPSIKLVRFFNGIFPDNEIANVEENSETVVNLETELPSTSAPRP